MEKKLKFLRVSETPFSDGSPHITWYSTHCTSGNVSKYWKELCQVFKRGVIDCSRYPFIVYNFSNFCLVFKVVVDSCNGRIFSIEIHDLNTCPVDRFVIYNRN